MKEDSNKHKINSSRRNFIRLDWIKKESSAEIPAKSEKTQKMLTADGRLVEVNLNGLSTIKSATRARNREIFEWMSKKE